uniref:Uncharacterized protein n=1 Tax=Leersia perrieri TaxID=77586 RepID=A0A0D9WEA9_9ORYZ
MESNVLSPRRILPFLGTLAAANHRCLDPVSAAYSTASMLALVLWFWSMNAVARAPAGPRRQAAVVALSVALTGLVNLQIYYPTMPRSTAVAIWAVCATFISAFFLVVSARPQGLTVN